MLTKIGIFNNKKKLNNIITTIFPQNILTQTWHKHSLLFYNTLYRVKVHIYFYLFLTIYIFFQIVGLMFTKNSWQKWRKHVWDQTTRHKTEKASCLGGEEFKSLEWRRILHQRPLVSIYSVCDTISLILVVFNILLCVFLFLFPVPCYVGKEFVVKGVWQCSSKPLLMSLK